MGRDRYQRGWVEETGKHIKKWKGHYYVYERRGDGNETRHHRAVILGLKAEMTKGDAKDSLKAIIDRETKYGPQAPSDITVEWFWKNRYKPAREGILKRSSLEAIEWIMVHHIIPQLGTRSLRKLERHECQALLNDMATRNLSRSAISKARTYLKSMLDEAVEDGLLVRNPAGKLKIRDDDRSHKPFLTEKQIGALLAAMAGRDRLILRLFLECGFRPGELFALRWDDWEPGQLRVDEAVWRGELTTPKTAGSEGWVVLPPSVEKELRAWQKGSGGSEGALIFPSSTGTPLHNENWLNRSLRPVAKAVKVPRVNYQMLRRSFATLMQKFGSVKDAQTQLRHKSPQLTAGIYMQAIPESVSAAVSRMDAALVGWMDEAEKHRPI